MAFYQDGAIYLQFAYDMGEVEITVTNETTGKWTPPYLRAEFENGEVFLEQFYSTNYGRAFGLFSRPSCYSCVYKGDKRVADITLGDYWGCTEADSFYNPGGVSVIFVHTEKGAALLDGVRDLELTETEFEHASRANPMLFRSKAKSPHRDVFAEVFAAKGLAAACRKSKTTKQQVLVVAGKWFPGWVRMIMWKVLKCYCSNQSDTKINSHQ